VRGAQAGRRVTNIAAGNVVDARRFCGGILRLDLLMDRGRIATYDAGSMCVTLLLGSPTSNPIRKV
jgi:hypothetical protein